MTTVESAADERAGARITELENRVETLDRQRVEASDLAARNSARIQTLTRDIEIIADELRSEAVARDWCSDYGNYVDNVNARTSQAWLKHCEFTYNMSFYVTVAVTLGGSSDDAVEDVRAQLENIGLSDGELDSIDVQLRGVDRA
jgi:uncharacterized protein YciU (UPF0263 family)